MGEKRQNWMRMWGSVSWWINVCLSVPFGLYASVFLYGKFELYKHLTTNAAAGRHHLAGLHIVNNLRTWQMHSLGAVLLLLITPLQFTPSFRNKYPVIHKRLGYVYATATVVLSVSGSTTMLKVTELGPYLKRMSRIMGPLFLITLAKGISAARNKDFRTHQQWMLRCAAIGYAPTYTRVILPGIIQLLFPSVSLDDSIVYSFPLSWFGALAIVEVYIQVYLRQPSLKRATSSPASTTTKGLDGPMKLS